MKKIQPNEKILYKLILTTSKTFDRNNCRIGGD